MKMNWTRVVGLAGVIGGSSAMYASGATADATTGIVGAVFVLGGIVSALLKE